MEQVKRFVWEILQDEQKEEKETVKLKLTNLPDPELSG